MNNPLSRKDIELLAPAGSFESLTAAWQGGADSVYFGLEHLNMRARSSFNFKMKDLVQISAFAVDHKMKAYLALNSLIYDEDIALAKDIIDAVKESGIDAIIASDQSVLSYAREKKVAVHLSTQLNISNIETLKFYAQFAEVAVLARELSISQIKQIFNEINVQNILGQGGKPIRIELFIHGALCMAISGKCYLSLHQYDKSANRGECLQACRREYIVKEKETGKELEIENSYIMSPKDLCTIDFIDKILEAGVSVLKIEGRARSPEYVKTVTSCYNEAIHSFLAGNYNIEKAGLWKKRLAIVFNRGFWDGYYLGQKLGEWNNVYGSRAEKRKVYIGYVKNYFSKLNVAEIQVESDSFSVGDEGLIIGSTTGVVEIKVNEIRVDDINVELVTKGCVISMPVGNTVRRSDKVYKLVSTEFAELD
jgi:putative protease